MKVCILGRHGLIGSALERALVARGWEVTSNVTPDIKMLFNFASTVHPPFEENPDYHINELIQSALYLLPFCRDNDIDYIYPSSALVYEKDTQFATTKKILEMMASMYPRTLGVRIFPVYGPGENRTVISQWCRAMKRGERPVVYGDGTQERDFIYVEDVITQIFELISARKYGVSDVGAGKPVSFNTIIKAINLVLGTTLEPEYIEKPFNYSQGIVCKNPMQTDYSLAQGIELILKSLDHPMIKTI